MNGKHTFSLVTHSAAETRSFGAALASVLRGGDEVFLHGDLGAGKTTLTKGIVAALGGGDVVTSPTFTLCHRYPSSPPVAHVDCFRVDPEDALADLDLDCLLEEGYLVVVEWAERARSLSSHRPLVCRLSSDGEDPELRRIEIDAAAGVWRERLPALAGVMQASPEANANPQRSEAAK